MRNLDKKFEYGEIPLPSQWKNPPTQKDLYTNFMDSKSAHDVIESERLARLEHLNISGGVKYKPPIGKSGVQPKVIRKHAEWRYSALTEAILNKRTLIDVKPRGYKDAKTANQNKLLLNYQWDNELNRVLFIDTLIRVFVDNGFVYTRVAWEFAEEPVKKEVPQWGFYPVDNEGQLLELQKYLMMQQEDSYAYEQHTPDEIKQAIQLTQEQGVPVFPLQVGLVEVTEYKTLYNRPTLEVCNPANCYPDPSCNGDLSKAQFFIYSFETSKSDLKRDGRYFNLDKIKVESPQQEGMHTSTTEDSFQFKDSAREKLVAYEYWGYWDVLGNGITKPIVAVWVGDTLIRLEENPYPNQGIPFEFASYSPNVFSLSGSSDGDLLRDNQAIIGAVTRGAIDLLSKSANSQEGIMKGALDPINLRRYRSGQDYQFNPTSHPTGFTHLHQYPEVPQSVPLMLGIQHNEAESLTGIKPFTGGLSGNSLGDTATAIRSVLDASAKRESSILRRISELLVRSFKKIAAMNAEFLSDEEVIRLTDEEFVTIRRDELQGCFDFEIDLTSAEVENAQASELAFLLQTAANTLPFDMVKLVLSELFRLRKMPHLAKRVETYQPQPDPLQQQIQQMELQKLQLENTKLQAEIGKLQADTQKSLSEAQLKSSERDQKDLDFLEQQSGVKHQRDIAQDTAQSQGNIALEIVKSHLNRGNTNV